MSILSIWRERAVVGGRWTLKDVVQGKPLNHPSHPLFVHFPSALLPSAFLLDVISRLNADLTLTRAALYDMALGLGFAALAALTGLVDYLPMVGGSRKKQLGTYHLVGQLTMVALFAASLIAQSMDYSAEQAPWMALVLAGFGTVALAVANFFGGQLVYRQGMRVSVEL